MPGNSGPGEFDRVTIRNVVFSSVGGTVVRVRFTNVFGTRPVEIVRAAVGAESAGAGLRAGENRPLTFNGRRSVVIPNGGEVLSDPVSLRVTALGRLAISIFLPHPTGATTLHAQARQLSYLAAGDHVLDPSGAAFASRTQSWYYVDGVDVLTPGRDIGTVVTLGDSITDGVGSPLDANARWPNDLARRLDARPGPTLGVIDEGIGGNRVLSNSRCCGVNAISRFGRDVVDQLGVRAVILLEGINDIGMSQSRNPLTAPHVNVSAAQIIAGYERIIRKAHTAGLKIFGGTLTPFHGAPYWTPAGEAKREAVNRWILTSGAFDGVVDFDRVLADPANPLTLNPAYDSGDHLHPNDAGYRAMARAVPLGMLLDRPAAIRSSAAGA